jgi:copper resistance protein D
MIDPLMVMRGIHLIATALVAGAVFFAYLIAEPAWRRSGGAEALIIRLRRQIAWLRWAALVVAIISGGGWLVVLATEIADKPVGDVMSDNTVWILLTQTQFGFVWQLRLVLAALLANICLLGRLAAAQQSDLPGFLAVIVAAGFAGALAWAGHGGSTPGRAGDLHVAADVLHLIAAAAWLGGLVPLVLLLGQQPPGANGGWTVFVGHAIRRFSTFGIISVSVLIISGIINAWFLVGDTQALIASDYGRCLLLKLAMFGAMVGLASVNRFGLMPYLQGTAAGLKMDKVTFSRIRRNALVEIALGVAIFGVVALLGSMPPSAEESLMHMDHHMHSD